jgi:hypothetical protein
MLKWLQFTLRWIRLRPVRVRYEQKYAGEYPALDPLFSLSSLPTSIAAPAWSIVGRRVVARLPRWSVKIISSRRIGAVKVRAPRGCAIGGAIIVALAVVAALTVIGLLAIVALIEVVKQEGEREWDTPANLGLSRALGCEQ